MLSYASYALHNWRRLDPQKPIELGNVVLLQNFLGGLDEEWFVLIHIDIEAKAGPGLVGLVQAHNAARDNKAGRSAAGTPRAGSRAGSDAGDAASHARTL